MKEERVEKVKEQHWQQSPTDLYHAASCKVANTLVESPVQLLRLPEKALFTGAQYRFVLNVSDSTNPNRRFWTTWNTSTKITGNRRW